MHQQQSQIDVQNQQMNQMLNEHDGMKRQLAMQRQAHQQSRQQPKPTSRQKEFDALALLNNFQRSLVFLLIFRCFITLGWWWL